MEQTWTATGHAPDPIREFLDARFAEDLRWAETAEPRVAARLRAEVEAKRLVTHTHDGFNLVAEDESSGALWFCEICVITTLDNLDLPVEDWEYERAPCRVMRGFAWVYRDHPDWQPGWEIGPEDESRETPMDEWARQAEAARRWAATEE